MAKYCKQNNVKEINLGKIHRFWDNLVSISFLIFPFWPC